MKRFFRILTLWTVLYFVVALNCAVVFWSWMGHGRYFVRFSLVGMKYDDEFYWFDSVLHEFEGLEKENLLWVEKIRKFRKVGIAVVAFNVVSAGFVIWWEKVKYYKQVCEWGVKEKALVCLGFLFKALPALVWWDGTQSSRTGNCEVMFVGDKIQDPCTDVGFVLEIVCIFGFIINVMISIIT